MPESAPCPQTRQLSRRLTEVIAVSKPSRQVIGSCFLIRHIARADVQVSVRFDEKIPNPLPELHAHLIPIPWGKMDYSRRRPGRSAKSLLERGLKAFLLDMNGVMPGLRRVGDELPTRAIIYRAPTCSKGKIWYSLMANITLTSLV